MPDLQLRLNCPIDGTLIAVITADGTTAADRTRAQDSEIGRHLHITLEPQMNTCAQGHRWTVEPHEDGLTLYREPDTGRATELEHIRRHRGRR